jgi:aminoglycoside 3-N-acetyltransferase I
MTVKKRNDSRIVRLAAPDFALMKRMLRMFGEAFAEVDTYCDNQPDRDYLSGLLGSDFFVALAATKDDEVVGGLAAYVLPKFEQKRSEMYVYDLAVAKEYRRKGIATALIQELRKLAVERDVHTIFIQADVGDNPAIELYTKFGIRENVLNFDISPA